MTVKSKKKVWKSSAVHVETLKDFKYPGRYRRMWETLNGNVHRLMLLIEEQEDSLMLSDEVEPPVAREESSEGLKVSESYPMADHLPVTDIGQMESSQVPTWIGLR